MKAFITIALILIATIVPNFQSQTFLDYGDTSTTRVVGNSVLHVTILPLPRYKEAAPISKHELDELLPKVKELGRAYAEYDGRAAALLKKAGKVTDDEIQKAMEPPEGLCGWWRPFDAYNSLHCLLEGEVLTAHSEGIRAESTFCWFRNQQQKAAVKLKKELNKLRISDPENLISYIRRGQDNNRIKLQEAFADAYHKQMHSHKRG